MTKNTWELCLEIILETWGSNLIFFTYLSYFSPIGWVMLPFPMICHPPLSCSQLLDIKKIMFLRCLFCCSTISVPESLPCSINYVIILSLSFLISSFFFFLFKRCYCCFFLVTTSSYGNSYFCLSFKDQ